MSKTWIPKPGEWVYFGNNQYIVLRVNMGGKVKIQKSGTKSFEVDLTEIKPKHITHPH